MSSAFLGAAGGAEAARREAAALGTTGVELGTRIGTALRDFIVAQAAEALANAPNWQASLQHLADYVQQQLSGIAAKTTQVEQRCISIEQRVAGLETFVAAGLTLPDAPLDEPPPAVVGAAKEAFEPRAAVRVIDPGAIAMPTVAGGGDGAPA